MDDSEVDASTQEVKIISIVRQPRISSSLTVVDRLAGMWVKDLPLRVPLCCCCKCRLGLRSKKCKHG